VPKALLFDDTLRLVKDQPKPRATNGESLVSVHLAGICNTDLEIAKGYMNFRGIIGHEFVGTVEESTSKGLVGRRVVGEINCVCGQCVNCQNGRATHCANRTTVGIDHRDGALAEYVAIPNRNLHIVPDGVSDEAAVFAEPLAAALEILEQIHVKPTDKVVVLGDGKLGLLVAQVISLTGADVTVVGRYAHKLRILDSLGIPTMLLDRASSEAGATAASDDRMRAADIVIECAGKPEGLSLAREIIRPRGTIVLKSTYVGSNSFSFTQLAVDEVRIVGSRCGPFAPALRLLAKGSVQVEAMIEAVFSIDDAERAFAAALAPGAMKVLIRPRH
jgi:alcohol dehydrogenase